MYSLYFTVFKHIYAYADLGSEFSEIFISFILNQLIKIIPETTFLR